VIEKSEILMPHPLKRYFRGRVCDHKKPREEQIKGWEGSKERRGCPKQLRPSTREEEREVRQHKESH
jgi:hypothetical protein